MRLEIESTVSAPHLTEDAKTHDVVAAELKSMLNQGIKAAQNGNRALARMSLRRATELDPRNESAWLWLASISEYPEELLGYLNNVLEINPVNRRALEWKGATNALLARTYVQRGIDACDENQKDFAYECFQTALQYDEKNATAYMWMASLASSNAVRVSLLQKALEFEPGNESVLTALEDARASVVNNRLTEAKTAVVAGNNAHAMEVLDDLLTMDPRSVEAWTLKSHLADGFDEKIRCFECILAIDPDNVAARAGRDSLLSIFGTMPASESEGYRSNEFRGVGETVPEAVIFDIPTGDLEFPESLTPSSEGSGNNSHTSDFLSKAEVKDNNDTTQDSPEPSASDTAEVSKPASDDLESESPSGGVAFVDPDEANVEHADPQAETVAYKDHWPEFVPVGDQSSPSGELMIPMPGAELPIAPAATGFETTVMHVETLEAKPESFECMFCSATNDPQSITCRDCLAVLTLSDLELLLANHSANKIVLRQAVEEMERQRATREFNGDELVMLGIGHLNLRNLQLGYDCLVKASRIQPDNVVLSGQVNELQIRLDEIRQQEEAHMRMPKGKSILVVDDSPTVRKLICGKLEKSGHDVVCANDGVEAMEQLQHFVPDLVLLDITMPRMDGYQVCKNIRSNSATKDVPVVMISGKDGFFDKVRGRMAGTTGYITKPFGPETLMKAVEMYLAGEVPDLDEV